MYNGLTAAACKIFVLFCTRAFWYRVSDIGFDDFYNIINDVKKQCIVITKDFITGGKVRMNDVDKLSCRVYRIKKAEGFNNSDLSTVRTLVKEIKTED